MPYNPTTNQISRTTRLVDVYETDDPVERSGIDAQIDDVVSAVNSMGADLTAEIQAVDGRIVDQEALDIAIAAAQAAQAEAERLVSEVSLTPVVAAFTITNQNGETTFDLGAAPNGAPVQVTVVEPGRVYSLVQEAGHFAIVGQTLTLTKRLFPRRDVDTGTHACRLIAKFLRPVILAGQTNGALITINGQTLDAYIAAQIAPLSDAITNVAAGQFLTRTALRLHIEGGATYDDGTVFRVGNLLWSWEDGAADIPDLPNLVPLEPFRPRHFGAVGSMPGVNPTIDDSAPISAMAASASNRSAEVDLDRLWYLVRDTTISKITKPIVIRGHGPLTRIVVHEDYRGPVFQFDGLNGIALDTTGTGGLIIDGVEIVAKRRKTDGSLVPIGVQHGMAFTGRCDRVRMSNVVIEGFRAAGILFGHGGATTLGFLREAHFYAVRVRECGAGTSYAAIDFVIGPETGDSSNNVTFVSCHSNRNVGPSFRIFSESDRRKSNSHFIVKGFMCHGAQRKIDAEWAEGFNFGDFANIELSGPVGNFVMTGAMLNKPRDGTGEGEGFVRAEIPVENPNYVFGVKNPRLRSVTLATDAVVTANGSADVTITLPALPTASLAAADIETTKGSPEVRFRWADAATRPAVGDTVSIDTFTDGVRTERNITVNGLGLMLREYLVRRVEGEWLCCRAGRNFATSSGTASGGQTLSRTHGISPTQTTISFDTPLNGEVVRASEVVGGIQLSGRRTVVGQTAHNVAIVQYGTPATSDETSSFAAPRLVYLDSKRRPTGIKLQANQTSGEVGVLIDAGAAIDIDMSTVARQHAVKVTKNIHGYVNLHGAGGEGTWILDVDPQVRSKVAANTATNPFLPSRAAVHAVGANPETQWFRFGMRAQTSTGSARRLTADGLQALTASNAFGVPSPGIYTYEVQVAALQVAGTAGAVHDNAFWRLTVTARLQGSTFSVLSINSNPALVGVDLSPDEATGSGSGWRLNIAADDALDTLNMQATGAADSTVQWGASVQRLDVYETLETEVDEEEEDDDE